MPSLAPFVFSLSLVLFLIGTTTAGEIRTGIDAAVPQSIGQNRNVINGMIIDTSHNPVQNIRVELLDDVNMLLTSTRTDATGRFRFTGLSQGAFQVKVVTGGTNFAEQITRVELINLRPNSTHQEQIEITLKTIDENKGRKGPINPGITFAQNIPENARKSYEKAVELLTGDRDVPTAIDNLLEAIKLYPDYYLALERLGAEYVRFNQFEPARIVLTRAIEINPRGALSHFALGVANFKLKQYRESTESLQRCVNLAPVSQNTPMAHYYLGMSLLKENKPAEAVASFKKAYQMGDKQVPPDGHMALAQIHSDGKHYKEAADELELYLKATPNAPNAANIRDLIAQLRAKAK